MKITLQTLSSDYLGMNETFIKYCRKFTQDSTYRIRTSCIEDMTDILSYFFGTRCMVVVYWQVRWLVAQRSCVIYYSVVWTV